jgi:uncharacterized protein YjdB
VTWSSDDEAVADFTEPTAGLVIGLAPGEARITAGSGSVTSSSVLLTVILTADGGLPSVSSQNQLMSLRN